MKPSHFSIDLPRPVNTRRKIAAAGATIHSVALPIAVMLGWAIPGASAWGASWLPRNQRHLHKLYLANSHRCAAVETTRIESWVHEW